MFYHFSVRNSYFFFLNRKVWTQKVPRDARSAAALILELDKLKYMTRASRLFAAQWLINILITDWFIILFFSLSFFQF